MGATHLDVLKVLGYQGTNADRDVEEVQGILDELVGDGPVCIGKIQPHHMQVTSLSFCSLDLLPYDCRVFHAPWEAWHACLLAASVDVPIAYEVGGQPLSQDGEENLAFNIQECDAPELANGGGVHFLRDEHCNSSPPL